MDILICTHGRGPLKQITYKNLPPEIQKRVSFVVQAKDFWRWEGHETVYDIEIVPDEIRTLPDTRQWIQHNMGQKVCMMDDDLVFATRRPDDPTKFRTPEEGDLERMFDNMDKALDYYAHVGVSHREGANRNTKDYIFNSRMMRVLAYRTDVVRREGVVSNRTPDVEDFDVTLQLLRKGYTNCILNSWVHNQGGSDQSGGCSEYRTPETHDRDVRVFAEHHKGFVKVVKKKTKDGWGALEDGYRTDVIVQWKKAREAGGDEATL